MNWSFRIGQVSGIAIRIHITFFLILILGAIQWGGPYGGQGAVFGVILMLLLFTCVVLHELGHSLVAQQFHIPVREIVLLPIGGVALLSRTPSKPLHELLIALAGPLVNVIIAAILLAITGATTALGLLDTSAILQTRELTPSFSTLLLWLLAANISLVVFNLIPAFPLDGGRILRAILAMVMSFRRATQISAAVGQLIAIALGSFGLVSGNLVLVLVAVFIFFGANQENAESQAQRVLVTLKVGDAYNKHALTLEIGDRVSKVVGYILTSYQSDFAVMQGSKLLGIVTRDDVLRALADSTQDVYVSGIMKRDVVRVDANTTLDQVRQMMAEQNARVVAVYAGETYLGLVSREDIAEAFAVIAFLQRQQEARKAEEAGTRS
jgi:Zn-dependent protease/predicted transcriptional regulator